MGTRRARRWPGEQPAGDEGFTLIELLVSMIILSIFMGVVTDAVVQMSRGTLKVEAINASADQLDTAFLRLDKEIRYAAAINPPGQVGADWYVEFQSTYTGAPVCTQLRLDGASQQLQQRTWAENVSPVSPSPWQALAFHVVNNPATQPPFTFSPTDATFLHQQLKIYLLDTTGPGSSATTSVTSITFSALNASPTAVTNTSGQLVCTEVARS
ncbi:MAG TPA: prepilin-type N-terminal cleavage/methylation domain-containing protein [Mycobacteriales bacterium]|nr:prepilin-type N-terminal cleavage/methylation domain-containing protein [Mycobacteriales bacterium]